MIRIHVADKEVAARANRGTSLSSEGEIQRRPVITRPHGYEIDIVMCNALAEYPGYLWLVDDPPLVSGRRENGYWEGLVPCFVKRSAVMSVQGRRLDCCIYVTNRN